MCCEFAGLHQLSLGSRSRLVLQLILHRVEQCVESRAFRKVRPPTRPFEGTSGLWQVRGLLLLMSKSLLDGVSH